MHITINEVDETGIRAIAVICATFIMGEGSEDEQMVLAKAATITEFIDDGAVILKAD